MKSSEQKQKIISMLQSKDESIQNLGLQLAKSQNIDLSNFWKRVMKLYILQDQDAFSYVPSLKQEIHEKSLLNHLKTKTYRIERTNITYLPNHVDLLKHISSLILQYNDLKALPDSIAKLPLELLSINCNKFTELPIQIKSLTNLRHLYFAGNKISELPIWLTGMQNLKYIEISHIDMVDSNLKILHQLVNTWYINQKYKSFHILTAIRTHNKPIIKYIRPKINTNIKIKTSGNEIVFYH